MRGSAELLATLLREVCPGQLPAEQDDAQRRLFGRDVLRRLEPVDAPTAVGSGHSAATIRASMPVNVSSVARGGAR